MAERVDGDRRGYGIWRERFGGERFGGERKDKGLPSDTRRLGHAIEVDDVVREEDIDCVGEDEDERLGASGRRRVAMTSAVQGEF